MFDAKKLLDALGTSPGAAPATPAAPAAPAPPPAEASAPKPSATANPLGAGTLLSELIGLANQPAPPSPPPAEARDGEQPPPPPKPKPAAAPPADLTDLFLGKAQEYLKTPQGNAAMNAVVLGLTKAVVNSEVGRKLTETAKTKSIGLFNRFMNKGTASAPAIAGNTIEGRALPSAPAPAAALPPPPAESNSGETALLVMRAMIAAAAADGRIDEGERERILGTLQKAGIDGEGVHIIEAELARPASAAELAAAVKSPEAAIQVYTAARRIITPNTVEERVFLAHLSAALGLDPRVVAQIDALASGAIPG